MGRRDLSGKVGSCRNLVTMIRLEIGRRFRHPIRLSRSSSMHNRSSVIMGSRGSMIRDTMINVIKSIKQCLIICVNIMMNLNKRVSMNRRDRIKKGRRNGRNAR